MGGSYRTGAPSAPCQALSPQLYGSPGGGSTGCGGAADAGPRRQPVSDSDLRAGERAIAFVDGLIKGPAAPAEPRTLEQSAAAGERRMARMQRFLDRLRLRPDELCVVHVAGTSGKGTTATKIAAGLTAAGYRTGLHCTPYLQTALEKFVLDGRLARPGEVADMVDGLRPTVASMARDDPDGAPTYGMAWVALTLEYFRRQAVDVLVLEVGAGGRFDLTNVVRPILSVIASVGFDHAKSLGGTLEAIAWHKAGVLKAGTPAVIGHTPRRARAVLQREVDSVGARAEWPPGEAPAPDARVSCAELARRALRRLRELGFGRIDDDSLAAADGAMPPARFEWMPDGAKVLLDGAHNPDKSAALARVLRKELHGRPIVLVGGVVGYRSARETLAPLLPHAHTWIATEPRVLGKPAAPADRIARDCADLLLAPVVCEPDPRAAIARALEIRPAEGAVVVAGSLYLAGNVRERWYAADDIVRWGTMWPPRPDARHT